GPPVRQGKGRAKGLLAADGVEALDGQAGKSPAELALRGEQGSFGVERDRVGHDVAAKLKRFPAMLDDGWLPATTDEDRIWHRQRIEYGSSIFRRHFEPWYTELRSVTRGARGADGIALDADGLLCLVTQQPLDGHGPGAAADIPQQFAGTRRERRQRHGPDLALGDLTIVLENVVWQARGKRNDPGVGAGLHFDGDEIQRLDVVQAVAIGGRGGNALARSPHGLQHTERTSLAATSAEMARDRGRRRGVG